MVYNSDFELHVTFKIIIQMI